MFWDTLSSLCKAKNTYPNTVCEELGFSNATATKWKHGSMPHGKNLQKIADYFDVTVSYLVSGGENAEASLSDAEKAMLAWFRGLSDTERTAIMTLFVDKGDARR